MNFRDVHNILLQLKSTSSRKQKEKILQMYTDDPVFRKVIVLACDPFIKFHVVKLPEFQLVDGTSDPYTIFTFLEKLAQQKSVTSKDREELMSLIRDRYTYEVVKRILSKNLDCGISTTIARKYIPEIREFGCMLCHPDFETSGITTPFFVSWKLDGMRLLVRVTKDDTECYTRRGHRLAALERWLSDEIEKVREMLGKEEIMLDGEVYSDKIHFQDLLSTVKRQKNVNIPEHVKYWVFDVVDYENLNLPQWKRLQIISSLNFGKIQSLPHFLEKDVSKIPTWLDQALSQGYEGLVIKDHDTVYEFKRSKKWAKVKKMHTEDLLVIDVEEGKGNAKGKVGALVCQYGDKIVKVGSGLDDETRISWWNNPSEIIGKIVEVQYQEKTKDGNLRFPVFVRVREDLS